MSAKFITPQLKLIINEAARKCFGNLPIVNHRTGFKLLKQKPIGPMVTNYYLPNYDRQFKAVVPEFKTELEQRRSDQLDRFRRFGKGPPKKGQGKRSKKKK